MGSTEVAANLFRATQTEEKLRREGITANVAANRTHHDVGGTPAEQLPTPAQSIQALQQAEQRRLDGPRRPFLFGEGDVDVEHEGGRNWREAVLSVPTRRKAPVFDSASPPADK